MNTYYDQDAMKAALSQLYEQERVRVNRSQVNILFDTASDATVRKWQYPPSIRIFSDDDSEVEFKLQAVICGTDLPPVQQSQLPSPNEPQHKLLNKFRNLRQHVKLTGFGNPQFGAARDRMDELQRRIQLCAGNDTVLPFNYIPYEGYQSLNAHTRFTPCEPALFKPGDLVEVHFTIVGIPIKKDRYMVKLNLRAIAMIDNFIRRASEASFTAALRTMAAAATTQSPTKLKRKRLCEPSSGSTSAAGIASGTWGQGNKGMDDESDEGATDATRKLQRMELDR
ncbi:hypothetical protein NMY22_g18139 [Coprinellus aureogranulatus]|nr:hypothetical protein NMY22_g18139 [Coprinellus aureogranulatus]